MTVLLNFLPLCYKDPFPPVFNNIFLISHLSLHLQPSQKPSGLYSQILQDFKGFCSHSVPNPSNFFHCPVPKPLQHSVFCYRSTSLMIKYVLVVCKCIINYPRTLNSLGGWLTGFAAIFASWLPRARRHLQDASRQKTLLATPVENRAACIWDCVWDL